MPEDQGVLEARVVASGARKSDDGRSWRVPFYLKLSDPAFEDFKVLYRMIEIGVVFVLAGLVVSVELAAASEAADDQAAKPLRAGIIGLDTSHVVAFTQLLNAPSPKPELAGVRVVAAYPGGSPDIPSSRDRVAGYTKDLRDKFGVTIVGSIDELLTSVDVVLLESVDGRPHLEQARPVFRARKPVFIDKPIAGSLADAIVIFELARETKTPCFSSSSLRFGPGVEAMRHNTTAGDIIGCDIYGPCALEEHHPDLFWYGIHGVETLFTILGTGCQSVSRIQTENTELAGGIWSGGRVGTFRGLRKAPYKYGGTVFGSKGNASVGDYGGYEPLVIEIVKFFKTGKPPVSAEETLEIYAFMEAADESKRQGGKPVTLESVMAKAKAPTAK
jgi:Oxidoreductase family, NAD-binding Rossmann fold